MQRVESTAREFIAHSSAGSVSAIGLGICELVDREGRVVSGHRVHWQRTAGARETESQLLQATVESDVRAAALAEAHFGAGRDYRDFLFVNIGTGIRPAW